MSTKPPELIIGDNLSHAWARAFLANLDRSDQEIAPLTLSIGGFENSAPIENVHIRAALDDALEHYKKQLCAESALIFPYNIWNRLGRPPCAAITSRYLRMLPRLKARERENPVWDVFRAHGRLSGPRHGKGSGEAAQPARVPHPRLETPSRAGETTPTTARMATD